MHEMLTIVTDVRGVCLTVCLSVTRFISASLYKNGWTDQDAVWDEHSWKFMKHCVRRDPPTEKKGAHFQILGPPHISGTAEATDLKFLVQIERWGS